MTHESRPLYLVHWRDASHSADPATTDSVGLVDLWEIGFLFHNDDDGITLTMELQEDDPHPKEARLWLTIPHVNIVEIYTIDFPQLARYFRRYGS